MQTQLEAAIKRFPVTKQVRVSTYDIDYAGHVSNISYFRWLEDMRLLILDQYFPLETLMQRGYMPIIVESQIKYIKAITLFDNPQGDMWISGITSATMTFTAEFQVRGEVVTRASHLGLFLNPKTMKPTRLPPEIVSAFKNQ
ncbi:MAG: acyl-CoA thioesterase [Candidatus Obscuribacter sp.]|jgi:acyl-CoA thioester hydrolase|nr:acyl-CoA thioesterase [Candidatus Obscuribacter sp.]MDQ5964069.1 acyl-CoA thioester hydrolase [Cyanobacteriota bacterium erpe_2018_sw_39hr_WHONDRS-SW48-000098_B_bin.30]MBK7836195.1 acyl-CoA thioesterase [Candidatus Obscuribacter sp.]MBK9206032.1 acyl-CoA thioesterase [Candidatus Obscuribacter sp.]MBK9617947.1 acyl-CoA thioesterase [Candidatus Obscuribacter sp.]